ncbi:hypothetical protein Tco_1268508, partial [Tanacetum coccineum]
DDPERWIFAIMEYFSLLNTPADQRLRIMGCNLEGVAAGWFRWMSWNGLITTWDRLKLHLQRELLASKPITLGYVFSLARIIEARFKAISEKEQNIKEKADTYLPLQSKLASPKIKGSLNADEDIGVDEVSSAIDGVFDLGESNVETLGVGEDDDSGNATINGGDDAVESGVISILNSLIGHGSPCSPQLCGECYASGAGGWTAQTIPDGEVQARKSIKSAFQDNTLRARYKRRCCSLILAESDSLPHAHAQGFKVKHSAS